MELHTQVIDLSPAAMRSLVSISPGHYRRSGPFTILSEATAAGRRTLVSPEGLGVAIGAIVIPIRQQSLDLNLASSWDSITPTNYTVAANRAGKDFSVFALTSGRLICSPNAIAPAGYTVGNSRRAGGYHCECLDIGTISGHGLSGFLTGDIIPMSIWDEMVRPSCSPAGMAYSATANLWVDIYLQSGRGASTASVFNGTITDSIMWNDHVDDLAAVGKRLLFDSEFQLIAEGSNQKTNIMGSADPITTGGHIDTASRRMVSDIGCEDACGAMLQWLQDTQFKIGGLVDPTVDPAFSWYTLPGNKGSTYRQGTAGDTKMLAGGLWSYGSNCGSRCRMAFYDRWVALSSIGSRGCARSR